MIHLTRQFTRGCDGGGESCPGVRTHVLPDALGAQVHTVLHAGRVAVLAEPAQSTSSGSYWVTCTRMYVQVGL